MNSVSDMRLSCREIKNRFPNIQEGFFAVSRQAKEALAKSATWETSADTPLARFI